MDISDGCLKEVNKIIANTDAELNNKKLLIAVAIHRLFLESESQIPENFLAKVISDIYDLQEKGILPKQLRKMPKVKKKKK